MKRACLAVLVSTAILAGCNMNGNDASPSALTGRVEFHDAGMAIGGETDPHGFILAGDHAEALRGAIDPGRIELTPDQRERGYPGPIQWERLYLRHEGSLQHPTVAERRGLRVRVEGPVTLIHAGGVETPARSFPVMDVRTITPAGT